jgi:hypothetical protein
VHSTAGTTCCLYHLCVLCASPVSSPQCILTRPCSAAACVRPLCVIFSLAPVPHPWLVSPLCCRPVWRSTGGRRPQPLIGGATKHAAVDLQPLPLHLSPVSTTLSLSAADGGLRGLMELHPQKASSCSGIHLHPVPR